MAPPAKRRKVDSECRVFNDDWTEKYLFVEHNESAKCLICSLCISSKKVYNLKRHYETTHNKEYDIYIGQSRMDKFKKMKAGLKSQTSLMHHNFSGTEKTVQAS